MYFGGTTAPEVDLAVPGGRLQIRGIGMNASSPIEADGKVVYRDSSTGTDLVYSVTASGLKEDIVLRDARAPSSFAFSIDDADGAILDVRDLPDGGIELRNDGDWRVVIPPPTVQVADGDVEYGHAAYSWRRSPEGLALSVALNPEWRQGKAYPITIDPSMYFLSAAGQSMAKTSSFVNCVDCSPPNEYRPYPAGLTIGGTEWPYGVLLGGKNAWARAMLRFDVSDLPAGTAVQSAQLDLTLRRCSDSDNNVSCTSGHQINAHEATSDYWLHDNADANSVDFMPAVVASAPQPSTSGGVMALNVTAATQGWVQDPSSNLGLMIRTPVEDTVKILSATFVGTDPSAAQLAQAPTLRVTSALKPGVNLDATGLAGPKVCQDLEGGCSKEYVDPTDPGWESRPADGDDTLPNLLLRPEEGECSPTRTTCFTRQTTRDLGVVVDFTKVLDGNGATLLQPANLGIGLALGQPGQVARYQPCNNASDEYSRGCLNLGGYWYAKNHYADGRNNFSGGFFADNKPSSATYQRTCPGECIHYWGQRVQRIDIEVYPRLKSTGKRDNSRVNVRWTNTFPEWDPNGSGVRRNRRVYADFGALWLSRLGDADIARMTGTITRNGRPVAANEVRVRTFLRGTSPTYKSRATATSKGGHALQSFSVPNTNDSGRYDLGAVYSGEYNVKVQDIGYDNRNLSNPPVQRQKCFRILIDDLNDFANFNVGETNSFGRANPIPCPF